MLNDYKPTHDPNLDTFKVQYLLGISAILAILFPHDYRFSEVRSLLSFVSIAHHQARALTYLDPLDVLDLAGISSHSPSTLHVTTNR